MISTYDFMVKMKKAAAKWLEKYYIENGVTCGPWPKWEDVFVVWQCKTLQNIKMVLGAPGPNHILFEANYNGDKHETYFVVYDQTDKIAIKDEEE